jgi:hypothetical protein
MAKLVCEKCGAEQEVPVFTAGLENLAHVERCFVAQWKVMLKP